MAETPTLAVIGYGLWTAPGHDGPSSIAAMRAGLSGAQQSALWDASIGVPLDACTVSAHQWWPGETFLPELAYVAIQQCHDQIRELGLGDPDQIPILITTAPPDRPARSTDLEHLLLRGLHAKMGRDLPPGSGVLPGGSCGLHDLLISARNRLKETPIQIILGVESLLQQTIIDAYRIQNRLLNGENSSGFIPGEAAAAIIVAEAGKTGLPELRLTGLGQDKEPDRAANPDDPTPAVTGMTRAIKSALTQAKTPMADVGTLMADLNGEHTRFKESTIAIMRLDRLPDNGTTKRPSGGIDHVNLIEATGEIGAAFGPAALALGLESGRMGLLQLPHILFHCSEDDGTRTAIIGEFCP